MAAAAGHVPVLCAAALDLLRGDTRRLMLDCTCGLGGHAAAWLDTAGENARVIGLDRDPEMVERARARLQPYGERVRLVSSSYVDAGRVLDDLGEPTVDAMLLDVGVASPHLDDASRGFSLGEDGPLDMRFDRDQDLTAEDLVRTAPEAELVRIISEYGEERRARAVARGIVQARTLGPIRTTLHLAEIVRRAVGHGGRIHPATRTFQAIRIAVNDELDHMRRALESLPERLAVGGRIAVISFHSLEDRIAKQAFREAERAGRLRRLNKKPISAEDSEVRANPRSRSARLRAAERTGGES
jgi:16S rRNA (cytosine1402-N4)-methyltransferase